MTTSHTYFKGEVVPLSFELESAFAKGDYTIEILRGKKSVYVDTMAFKTR